MNPLMVDVIFSLKVLIRKYRKGQKVLQNAFEDFEKQYDRLPNSMLQH